MKLIAMILVALCLPFGAVSQQQVLCALGSGASAYRAASDERPTADAMQLIGKAFTAAKLLCGSMCPETVLFRNTTAPNVMLTVSNGRGKIAYAPQVFTAVYGKYGDPGIEALLAHEMGHELDDAMGAAWIDKSWSAELRADAWAGCVLAKGNLTGKELTAALAAMEEFPSPQHPGWGIRLPAIRTGYTQCGGL
jgi:hypothetical protein